ncbi:hypothetical protein ACWD0J_26975 [Streptomyces sp. NPDC003011]|uniref:hypothetical protein n=1 Tax=Streptomyces bobili TaxID=67280 RepID=UPI0034358652
MTKTTAPPRADHAAAAEGLREMPGVYLPVDSYITSYAAEVMADLVQDGDGHYGPAGAYDAYTDDVDGRTRLYVAYVAPLRKQNTTAEEKA